MAERTVDPLVQRIYDLASELEQPGLTRERWLETWNEIRPQIKGTARWGFSKTWARVGAEHGWRQGGEPMP